MGPGRESCCRWRGDGLETGRGGGGDCERWHAQHATGRRPRQERGGRSPHRERPSQMVRRDRKEPRHASPCSNPEVGTLKRNFSEVEGEGREELLKFHGGNPQGGETWSS